MISVLCVLLWYCFTIDLYRLRKYIWLVVLDRDNNLCSWSYVDGVLNKSEIILSSFMFSELDLDHIVCM